jgi:epoxyqueuosine reductase
VPRALTLRLRAEAERLGFVACGIAQARPLPEVRAVFDERIDRGIFAGLPWMNHARALRATEPDSVLPGAQSIVSLAAPYQRDLAGNPLDPGPHGRVASYAWGRDYHRVLEKMLEQLCGFLVEQVPEVRSRILVDYGPLAERAYAARAGIGWIGKSTNLLLPGVGSWVLLGEIVTTAVLDEDVPLRKSCGACRRCADACPTGAIEDGAVLNNELCISYQTIENRGPIPRQLRPLIGDWIFGCDICQEVCPVGRTSRAKPLPALTPSDSDATAPALLPLLLLDESTFRARFAGRAIMRAKRDGLLRNACVALGNLGDPRAVPGLAAALDDAAALVRGHAAWALGRLGGTAAAEALERRRSAEADDWVNEELRLALYEIAAHGKNITAANSKPHQLDIP